MSVENTPHPRDPDEYRYTRHFEKDILPDKTRYLDKEMVEETIAEGRDVVRSVNDSKIRRRKTYDGVDVVVVLGDRGGMFVITAWTEVNSMADALGSERWSREDIMTILEFEHQNEPNALEG
jgi:hypothetical protein